MNVTILYFGQARDLAGVERERVEAQAGASLDGIIRSTVERHGADLRKILLDAEGRVRQSVLVSVNNDVVFTSSATANDGDEIALFSAVAGG